MQEQLVFADRLLLRLTQVGSLAAGFDCSHDSVASLGQSYVLIVGF